MCWTEFYVVSPPNDCQGRFTLCLKRKEKLLVCHRDWTVTLFKENPIQAKQANIGSYKEITTKMTKIINVQANIGSSEEITMKMTKILMYRQTYEVLKI